MLSGLPCDCVSVLVRELSHAVCCGLQVWINPGVTRVEPDAEMPVLTPGGSSGFNDLLRRMGGQIFTWRCELEFLFVSCVANKLFQKNRSFEPPVPKKFRIEWCDNDWIKTGFPDFLNLLTALFQKVNCVLCCRIYGCRSVIKLFFVAMSGDPMIFHAGKFSYAARDRSQMLQR